MQKQFFKSVVLLGGVLILAFSATGVGALPLPEGNSAPTITSISPSSQTADYGVVDFIVNGTNFTAGSLLKIDGNPVSGTITVNADGTQISYYLNISSLSTGTHAITITTIAGTSDPATLIINASTQGTLEILKNSGSTNGDFTFTVTGPFPFSPTISTTNADQGESTGTTSRSVTPGTYAIREAVPAGWILNPDLPPRCYIAASPLVNTGTVGANGSISGITIEAGKTTLCKFNNTRNILQNNTARLTVTKVVVNTGGGTKRVSDFPLTMRPASNTSNGIPVVSGTPTTLSAPESWAVYEETDDSYAVTFSGDCNRFGIINLIPGDNKTCTITNTYNPLASNSTSATNPTNTSYITTLTPSEQTQVKNLQESLGSVQEKLKSAQNGLGTKREEIRKLQEFLNNNGSPIAPGGRPGSKGNETGIMAGLTKKALCKFQVEKLGLDKNSKSCGTLGPWTKSMIKEKYGVDISATVTSASPAAPSSALPNKASLLQDIAKQIASLSDAVEKLLSQLKK